VKKDYQTQTAPDATVLPEGVMVAMADIADAVEEGLLALAVAAGFGVLTAMMEQDVNALCGPKGRHNPQREAVRHGSEAGAVTLGGRRPRCAPEDGAPAPAARRGSPSPRAPATHEPRTRADRLCVR
jgi:hypothetical protein